MIFEIKIRHNKTTPSSRRILLQWIQRKSQRTTSSLCTHVQPFSSLGSIMTLSLGSSVAFNACFGNNLDMTRCSSLWAIWGYQFMKLQVFHLPKKSVALRTGNVIPNICFLALGPFANAFTWDLHTVYVSSWSVLKTNNMLLSWNISVCTKPIDVAGFRLLHASILYMLSHKQRQRLFCCLTWKYVHLFRETYGWR